MQQAQATQQREQEALRQKQAQDRLAAERAAQEKAAADKLAQEKQAQEKAAREAARKAEQEAARLAKEKAAADEARAVADYLDQVRRGTRLAARHCPDGKGSFYVEGLRPRIKPEKVSCVDVHYEALCPGQAPGNGVRGVAKNFIGIATDCFMGDSVEITPKPACTVKEVRVDVRDVRGCE